MENLLIALIIYFIIGIIFACVLKQSPYADNPIWVMILAWPLYMLAGI